MEKEALELIRKISDCGYKAYIVGGFVRDKILNRNSIDVDIATSAKPKEIKSIFDDVKIKDVNYGSVTVIKNKIIFEITTFRKDIGYLNNRTPEKIKYIKNLKKDLKRRDFTINTLCMDKTGNIIDILRARKDIIDKVIKMVGNPKYRLKEDALRILRAVRFATILDFKIDKKLEKYIIKYGYLLDKLSLNRKKEELDKIFSSVNNKKGIELLLKYGLDKYLGLNNLSNVSVGTQSISIWSQLNVLDIYPFSKIERENISKINELLRKVTISNNDLYKYGLYVSMVVAEIKGTPKKTIVNRYNSLDIHSRRDINITFKELVSIFEREDYELFKIIYLDIENAILMNHLINDNNEIKNYIIQKYK